MSRSNPTENASPNPATRFFEWKNGGICYYDKVKKENVEVKLPFTFIFLDQLGTVTGFDERNGCGIYANEVKDVRQDTLLVKSFKGGEIAHGLYSTIKDRVNAKGGKYTASCYVAFKDESGLALGNVKFKGGALQAWIEFNKANRDALFEKAITIASYAEDKKGGVVYRVPVFKLKEIDGKTNEVAVELDKTLQKFLASYLTRNRSDQTETPPPDDAVMPSRNDDDYGAMPEDDQIPF